jgi:hypothetical protein
MPARQRRSNADGAIGHGASGTLAQRTVARDVDRNVGSDRLEAEAAIPECDRRVHLLAAQQRADQRDRLSHRPCRLRGPDAEFGEAGDTRAKAEHGTAAGDFVQRRDRHCGQRGVSGEWIRHARPHRNARRRERDQCAIHLAIEPLAASQTASKPQPSASRARSVSCATGASPSMRSSSFTTAYITSLGTNGHWLH